MRHGALLVSAGWLSHVYFHLFFFFFQAEDGIRDLTVTWSSDVCSSDLTPTRLSTPPLRLTNSVGLPAALPSSLGLESRRYFSTMPRAFFPTGTIRSLSPLPMRSEEHTSELQSQSNLVCRLLLEKKKKLL